MSERKVLNKYYPPEFDPTKIPRLKRPANRQFSIRIMAPFNMRCANCGEYIYKGKKFNSRQERAEGEDYLGLMIFRFYIKCPRCVSEISFKTDPQRCDYELVAGATRNFEALRTAERLAEEEVKEKEEEEKNNPMKVLENRTKASQQEMEMLETLEEIREMNSRNAKLDHEQVIKLHKAYEEQLSLLQDEEDEKFVRSIFGNSGTLGSIKRIHDEEEDEDEGTSSSSSTPKLRKLAKPSDILTQGLELSSDTSQDLVTSKVTSSKAEDKCKKELPSWQRSIGGISNKKSLLGIVKKKQPVVPKPGTNTAEKTGTNLAQILVTATGNDNKVIIKEKNELRSSLREEVSNKSVVKVTATELESQPTNSESDEKNEPNSVLKYTPENKISDIVVSPVPTGLGLLGAYSGTDTDSDGT